MNYQDELTAKLESARTLPKAEKNNTISTESLEEKLLLEISDEFVFSQYDLDEHDILRTLKIMDSLNAYDKVFNNSEALKIFYIIARIDAIKVKKLHEFLDIEVKVFKKVLQLMSQSKLIFQNEDKEIELSLEGKSLAQRLGVYIF